ncbi:MAG: hypothetical protein D6706_16640 [Chloroflexi bacterium]|nr:MAG: hypothetical protein D6706_16640 [Chloroflexota bacterium]
MAKPNSGVVETKGAIRYFVQRGGSTPENPVRYSGQDAQFLIIENTDRPLSNIDPIYVPHERDASSFRYVGRNRQPPDLATFTVQYMRYVGNFPAHLATIDDFVTFYQVIGDTTDLSDLSTAKQVTIMGDAEPTSLSEGGGAWDNSEQIIDEVEYASPRVYTIGKIAFNEVGGSVVTSEVKGVTYGRRGSGIEAIYAVVDSTVSSPGSPPVVIYRTKHNGTVSSMAITGAASTDVPTDIAVVGKYLVVTVDDGGSGAIFVSELDDDTGVPGTFTKITGVDANMIYAPTARTVFYACDGGVIKRASDVSSGNFETILSAGVLTSEDLLAIHGLYETIVAVGNNDTVLYSTDRGDNWQASVSPGTGANITAVSVINGSTWWIGTSAGDVYYTTDKGNTWTQADLPAALTGINDIKFASPEVGFVAAVEGSTARLYTTYTAGVNWTTGSPRLENLGTWTRFNRIALPDTRISIAANHILLGGLGSGTDGVLLSGEPPLM